VARMELNEERTKKAGKEGIRKSKKSGQTNK